MTPSITITKIDHDSWWGYYIGEKLYGYDDYYNFSDAEVEKEAVLQAIDGGLITTRKDPLAIVWEHHHDWPELRDNEMLQEQLIDEFSSDLPSTLSELKAWIKEHSEWS